MSAGPGPRAHPEGWFDRLARRAARVGEPDAAGLSRRTLIGRGLLALAVSSLPIRPGNARAVPLDSCLGTCLRSAGESYVRRTAECRGGFFMAPNDYFDLARYYPALDARYLGFAPAEIIFDANAVIACDAASWIALMAENSSCTTPNCGATGGPGTGNQPGAPCPGGTIAANGACCVSPNFICPLSGACAPPQATICSCGCFELSPVYTCKHYCPPDG